MGGCIDGLDYCPGTSSFKSIISHGGFIASFTYYLLDARYIFVNRYIFKGMSRFRRPKEVPANLLRRIIRKDTNVKSFIILLSMKNMFLLRELKFRSPHFSCSERR